MQFSSKIKEVINEKGFATFCKKTFNWFFQKFLSLPGLRQIAYYFSLRVSKAKKKNEETLEDIVDTSFNFRGYGPYKSIKPAQVREEFKQLASLVKDKQPSVVLEVGTANGGTFYVWSRLLEPNSKLISLDLPGGKFGRGYSKRRVPFLEKFNEDVDTFFVRKDSHQEGTKRKIQEILAGDKIDFLFIDGDHTYEGVKKDFEMYAPLVAEGGLVAFHDIVPGPSENVGGVPEFWKEIKTKFKSKQIVKDWEQNGYGIGVIYK